jgi:hypothetical protein
MHDLTTGSQTIAANASHWGQNDRNQKKCLLEGLWSPLTCHRFQRVNVNRLLPKAENVNFNQQPQKHLQNLSKTTPPSKNRTFATAQPEKHVRKNSVFIIFMS